MDGCSAINCSNRSETGNSMYIIPAGKTRRKLWVLNLRRADWTPGRSASISETHFESSEFEQNRADGRKKLKPNAVPTLFNVPNPPKKHNLSSRFSVYKRTPSKENLKPVYSKMDLEKWEHQEFPVEEMMVKNISLNQENSTLQSLGTADPTSSNCISVHQPEQEPHVFTKEEVDKMINHLKKENGILLEQLNNKCNKLIGVKKQTIEWYY